MTNNDVVLALQTAARKIVVQHTNIYRIRAYRRAALAIQGLQRPVAQMSQLELELLPGVGTHIAKCVLNYTKTGQWLSYDEMVQQGMAI